MKLLGGEIGGAIDKDKFLFLYQNEYGTLNDNQRGGLLDLLGFIEADSDITDIRWNAYELATVKHECAGTWQPIAEYGKGKGRTYGEPDKKTGLVYYGRGYVQLTWADNYKTMGTFTGADLYQNPDLAMQPDIAYRIMSVGMRKGLFTGVGLSKYINVDKCDYVNARRIINGTDCAEKIAGYATTIEGMLQQCVNEESATATA